MHRPSSLRPPQAPWPEVPVWAEEGLADEALPMPFTPCPRGTGRQSRLQSLFAQGGPVIWEEDHTVLLQRLQSEGLTCESALRERLQTSPECLESLLATVSLPKDLPGCPDSCSSRGPESAASPWPCLLGARALEIFHDYLGCYLQGTELFQADLSVPAHEGAWRALHLTVQPSNRPGWRIVVLSEAPSSTRRGRLKAALAMLQKLGWTATTPAALFQHLQEALSACALPSRFLALVKDGRRDRIWTWLSPDSRFRVDESARLEALEAASQVLHGLPCHAPERACRLGRTQAALGAIILDPTDHPLFLSAEDLHTFRLLGGITGHLLRGLLASTGLARSQALLMQTQSMADLGSLEVEMPERMILWSPQARRIWGLDPDEGLPGYRRLLQRVHPEDRTRVKSAVARWRNSGEGLDMRFRLRLPDSETRWVATKGHLERNDEGHVDKYLLTFQDITESTLQTRRLAEQEARFRHEAEVKSMLLQEVNHRVKNNLTGILGMLDMEQRAAMMRSGIAAASMEDLKQRIYALARVHDLLSAEEWGPLRLDHMAEDIIRNTMAATAAARTVRLEVVCKGGPWRVPPRTATPLAMILAELTTNAVKYAFAFRTEGILRLRIEPEAAPSRRICLTFQDDGPGFPQDIQNGQADHVGLRLIRLNARNLLQGELTMGNQGGARIQIRFLPAPLPHTP